MKALTLLSLFFGLAQPAAAGFVWSCTAECFALDWSARRVSSLGVITATDAAERVKAHAALSASCRLRGEKSGDQTSSFHVLKALGVSETGFTAEFYPVDQCKTTWVEETTRDRPQG